MLRPCSRLCALLHSVEALLPTETSKCIACRDGLSMHGVTLPCLSRHQSSGDAVVSVCQHHLTYSSTRLAMRRRPASSPEEQDAWYMYDDDKPAQLLKPEQVSSQIAYVLCYCRSRKGAAGEPPKSIDTPV